jgi:hypothetical protein
VRWRGRKQARFWRRRRRGAGLQCGAVCPLQRAVVVLSRTGAPASAACLARRGSVRCRGLRLTLAASGPNASRGAALRRDALLARPRSCAWGHQHRTISRCSLRSPLPPSPSHAAHSLCPRTSLPSPLPTLCRGSWPSRRAHQARTQQQAAPPQAAHPRSRSRRSSRRTAPLHSMPT